MNLTDTAFVISSRCRLIPDQALDLLKYFNYIDMGSTERQDFTDAVMFLSVRGFNQDPIKEIIEKALVLGNTFAGIMTDPMFAEKEKNGPFLALNIDDTEIKAAMEKLSNAGVYGAKAGKSMSKAMKNLGNAFRLPNINQCPWTFKGTQCGYVGSAISCNNTFESCTELGNQEEFGGFPPKPKQPKFAEGGIVSSTPFGGFPDIGSGGLFGIIDQRDLPGPMNEKAPEGIDQDDWDVMSTKSKSFILKRLGYNSKKKEDINRAIDL